jgi:molybdopterin converting factor small subunit
VPKQASTTLRASRVHLLVVQMDLKAGDEVAFIPPISGG